MKPVLLVLQLLLLCSSAFSQTRWYVRADASPLGADAESWATATPFLQDALDAAQLGDTVWVSEGLYQPGNGADRHAAFVLKNGVRLYGGFAGTESQLHQRDWANHPSILSGDIGAPGDSTDNSYNLLYLTKTGLNTRIDGLVLEWANAGNPDNVNIFSHQPGHSGSAIYLDGQGSGNFAYLTMANCTLRHNRSDHFGAVYANGRDNGKAQVWVENCRFERNDAFFKGGAIAIENYALQPEPLLLQGSMFIENYGRSGGGAIYLEHHQSIDLLDCSFDRNQVFAGGGGAVNLFGNDLSHPLRFRNCSFTGNYTTGNLDGGAVSFYPTNSTTALQFFNCSFFENKASEGGCVNILNSNSQCPVLFEQCQFARNSANPGSVFTGSILNPLGGLNFTQCTFYENSNGELFLTGTSMVDTAQLSNCIFFKSSGSAFVHNSIPVQVRSSLTNRPDCSAFSAKAACDSNVIFNKNPFFVDPANNDFHLQPCSPAINAGDNALAAGILTDADDQPRIRAGKVDLGPYEHDLGFVPTSITPAACTDSRDGGVVFGGSNCAPVFIAWSMGSEIGTRTDSLAPGTYVFSFIDAAGHAGTETVVIPSLPALTLLPYVVPPTCAGANNGVAGVDISGGTDPYQIAWASGGAGSFLFAVPAGSYPVTVTDARGCVASAEIVVPGTPQIEVFYTVTPASGPNQADGAIQIDSVLTCMGTYAWTGPAQTNLLPGNHTITITDPDCGCFLLFTVTVGFTVHTEQIDSEQPQVWLAPNPVRAGQLGTLHRAANAGAAIVWVQDALGQVVQRMEIPPGARQVKLSAPGIAGLYWVVVRDELGRQRVLKWLVR